MSEVRGHVGADMVWLYVFRDGQADQTLQRKVQRVFGLPVNPGSKRRTEILRRQRWVQGSDWPFGKTGKPMKYLSRKTDGESTVFFF